MNEVTEYQLNSQKFTVNHFQKQHDKLTKEVDDAFINNIEDVEKMQMLFTVKRILSEQEEKYEQMKKAFEGYK